MCKTDVVQILLIFIIIKMPNVNALNVQTEMCMLIAYDYNLKWHPNNIWHSFHFRNPYGSQTRKLDLESKSHQTKSLQECIFISFSPNEMKAWVPNELT